MELEGPRPLEASEIRAAAQLWYDGWYEAHLDIVPSVTDRIAHARQFSRPVGGAHGRRYR